jgi:hypothetical protein
MADKICTTCPTSRLGKVGQVGQSCCPTTTLIGVWGSAGQAVQGKVGGAEYE